ncbi:YkgB family protein [Sphingosinicellaceae bacterium]|nr:YkgB family protein [Sphingosinicellaceae bacterium]
MNPTSTATAETQTEPEIQMAAHGLGATVARIGGWTITVALTIIFLWFGGMKFTPFEAEGLVPIISNNPLISWLYTLFGVQGGARFLGVFEIVTGLLIAARFVDPRASVLGGAMGAWSFVLTLSCIFTTPGVIAAGHEGTLNLSTAPGAFLLKDIVLFAACLWLIGNSLLEASDHRRLR